MTHPGSDGVIRAGGEVAAYGFDDEQDDPLRDVRHMLDRLYTADDGTESDYVELIRQILHAGLEQDTSGNGWR
ncbi:hypothetical protein ACQEVC_40485 [Plantactinospora sp. CA-294935]|uniref:hypothetical protein n=1 Tax=Plantactinospora sp. CA-294935 TaxID=3240012 RepID=UPI003D9506AD